VLRWLAERMPDLVEIFAAHHVSGIGLLRMQLGGLLVMGVEVPTF
jgi:hypothetical protein